MTPKLELKTVSYAYHSLDGETPALSHISFSVMPGEFLAVVGPSGCGKSTLLSLICGLAEPEEGLILVDGTPIHQARDRIGYMLQKDHLFEWRSILSNTALGLEIRRQLTFQRSEEQKSHAESLWPGTVSGKTSFSALRRHAPAGCLNQDPGPETRYSAFR